MMTHHVVHESFKNNISNNKHNIAQGGILFSGGANTLSRPLNATLHYVTKIIKCIAKQNDIIACDG